MDRQHGLRGGAFDLALEVHVADIGQLGSRDGGPGDLDGLVVKCAVVVADLHGLRQRRDDTLRRRDLNGLDARDGGLIHVAADIDRAGGHLAGGVVHAAELDLAVGGDHVSRQGLPGNGDADERAVGGDCRDVGGQRGHDAGLRGEEDLVQGSDVNGGIDLETVDAVCLRAGTDGHIQAQAGGGNAVEFNAVVLVLCNAALERGGDVDILPGTAGIEVLHAQLGRDLRSAAVVIPIDVRAADGHGLIPGIADIVLGAGALRPVAPALAGAHVGAGRLEARFVDAVQVLPARGVVTLDGGSGRSDVLAEAARCSLLQGDGQLGSRAQLAVTDGEANGVLAFHGAGDGRGGLVGAAQDNLGALRSGDKLPGVAHVLVVGHAVVGAGRLQGSVEVAGHGGVFRELDGRSRVLRGMIAVAALVEELDLGHGSEALVLVGEGEAELIRLDRCEVHGVVVRARSGRGTGLLPDGLPGLAVPVLDCELGGLGVAVRLAVVVEVQRRHVHGLLGGELQRQAVALVHAAVVAPERHVDGRAVHNCLRIGSCLVDGLGRGVAAVSTVLFCPGGCTGLIRREGCGDFRALGEVRHAVHAGLLQHVEDLLLGDGGVHRGGDGSAAVIGDDLDSAVGEGDFLRGGVIDDMGQILQGEGQRAVDVQGVALGALVVPGLAVVRLIPHDRQVMSVIADVVDHEVVIGEVDRAQLDLLIGTRLDTGHVLDEEVGVVAEDVVVDPGTIVVLIGSAVDVVELVVVRIADVACIGVDVPCHPLGHHGEHVVGDVGLLLVIGTQSGLIQTELHGEVDVREVVRTADLLVVDLVGGVEREDRELLAVGEGLEGFLVLRDGSGIVGDEAHGKVVVVVGLGVLDEVGLVSVMLCAGRTDGIGLELLALLAPHELEDVGLDLVGQIAVILGLLGVAQLLIELRGGVGSGPDVGVFAVCLPGAGAGSMHGDGIGVVAGHVVVAVSDEVTALDVIAVMLQLAGCVMAEVVREVLCELRAAADDVERLIAGLSQILTIVVVPVVAVAGVIKEGAALRGVARGQQLAIGQIRRTEPLRILQVHRLRQDNRVVVAEDALDGDGVLIVIAGDVGIERVEALQPPAIIDRLLDGLLRHVDVGQVLRPVEVVFRLLRADGLKIAEAREAEVLLGGLRNFFRREGHDDLQLHTAARGDGDVAGQPAIVVGRSSLETVAGHAGIDGSKACRGRAGAGQLCLLCTIDRDLAGLRRKDGVRCHRNCLILCGFVGQRHRRDGDVLLMDELHDIQRQVAADRVGTRPVTRRIDALAGVFLRGQAAVGVREENADQIAPAKRLMIGGVAAEADDGRAARVHIQRAAAGQEGVAVGVAVRTGVAVADALTGEDAVHIEGVAAIGKILLIDRHHDVLFGIGHTELRQVIDLVKKLCVLECGVADVQRCGCFCGRCLQNASREQREYNSQHKQCRKQLFHMLHGLLFLPSSIFEHIVCLGPIAGKCWGAPHAASAAWGAGGKIRRSGTGQGSRRSVHGSRCPAGAACRQSR